MKRYFLIIITLILCGLTTVGQTSNFETRYMQTHEKYKQSLDPVSYINIEKNVRDGYVFMMDVATNYPVSDNPMKYFYEYTPEGYKQNTLVKVLNNGNWEIDSYEICTFDIDGNILTSLWKIWVDGSLENDTYTTYSYDNGNILTYLNQDWDNNWDSIK